MPAVKTNCVNVAHANMPETKTNDFIWKIRRYDNSTDSFRLRPGKRAEPLENPPAEKAPAAQKKAEIPEFDEFLRKKSIFRVGQSLHAHARTQGRQTAANLTVEHGIDYPYDSERIRRTFYARKNHSGRQVQHRSIEYQKSCQRTPECARCVAFSPAQAGEARLPLDLPVAPIDSVLGNAVHEVPQPGCKNCFPAGFFTESASGAIEGL
ncbi:hypothetical protein FQR65_LT20816 [Abscondita terminalis]|nr:hypothetical protein FQR65_LT20816 [Abscondita terminalis]